MDNRERPVHREMVALKEHPPSEAIVFAVAEAADTDPTSLRPLHDVVDPDALDGLFRHRPSGTVSFEYQGYTVTVRENAEIIVQENAPIGSR